jgi:glycosyltransferase involved in cell wall biosynthesis
VAVIGAVIVLDVSRLIARAGRATPTGIDRVELAYARHLIAGTAAPGFARVTRCGRLTLLPRPAVERYVAALAALWRDGASLGHRGRVRWTAMRLRFTRLSRARAFQARPPRDMDQPVYLLVSHHHLEKRHLIARIKKRYGMRFVCLIHDLIPIEFPEYARPRQDKRHRRRIATVRTLADAVIVPSVATGEALGGDRRLQILAVPFGVDMPPNGAAASGPPQRRYFVCLGTIASHKNHLLLLNLWRDFARRADAETPALVLIGRRGWKIENTIDMLDRCPPLRGIVCEHGKLPDAEVVRLVKNARALLLPSHAEGFGFPLIEALACGTPVLCSDIPALHEIGGDVPEYFDPLDCAVWRAAILDYAPDPSPRREAQLQRLVHWQPPRWTDHFAAVDTLIARLATAPDQH